MAGHARYTALLDACVLFPLAMVDSLMSLAEAGLYAAKWSTRIEEEWMLALETKRPDLKGRLGTRRDAMREAVPDWEVPETAWKAVVGSVQLPDPDDAHVLAAAIAGHADCIVTVSFLELLMRKAPAIRRGLRQCHYTFSRDCSFTPSVLFR